MSTILYRKDIDGLRALAVLAVVLFHAFPLLCTGGYVGVDIFFVISGFLITSIIVKDIDNSCFTLQAFYLKRVKRIFPALIVFLSVFLLFGYFVLFDEEYANFGKHVFSSSLFMNNFTLIREAGYFDRLSDLKPLLHLWSLGVEEQFYIVWPLIICILSKKPKSMQFGLLILVVISFVINLLRAKHHATDAFYSPQSRFWELGIGGILAYFNFNTPLSSLKYPAALSFFGIFCLLLGVFTYHQQLFYPYWYALTCCWCSITYWISWLHK